MNAVPVIDARVLPKTSFSLEYDIGIKPGAVSDSVATANRVTFNLMGEAMWEGGRFKLANGGPTVPILKDVVGEGREYLFKGQPKSGTKAGGCVRGPESLSYPFPRDAYAVGNLAGSRMRMVRVDGENGGSVLRIRNTGARYRDFELLGRPIPTGAGGTGTPTPCLIDVEGHTAPATGRFCLERISGGESPIGIKALAGWYDDSNGFHADENHADHGTIIDCAFFSRTVFQSLNQQAVNYYFRNLYHEAGNYWPTAVALDIYKGGKVRIDGLAANAPQYKLVRVSEFSPNTNQIDITGIAWDGSAQPTDYISFFEYYGTNYWGGFPPPSWGVNLSGHLARNFTLFPFDTSKAFILSAGSEDVNLTNVRIKLTNLPIPTYNPNYEGAGTLLDMDYDGGGFWVKGADS